MLHEDNLCKNHLLTIILPEIYPEINFGLKHYLYLSDNNHLAKK